VGGGFFGVGGGGPAPHARVLLAIVMLERWLDHYLPRAFDVAGPDRARLSAA
jgi:hypothetical protein